MQADGELQIQPDIDVFNNDLREARGSKSASRSGSKQEPRPRMLIRRTIDIFQGARRSQQQYVRRPRPSFFAYEKGTHKPTKRLRTAKRRKEGRGKFVRHDGQLFYSVSASDGSSGDRDGEEELPGRERQELESALLPHEYQLTGQEKPWGLDRMGHT